MNSLGNVSGPQNAEARFWAAAEDEIDEMDESLKDLRSTLTDLARKCGLRRLRGLGKIGKLKSSPSAREKQKARAAAKRQLQARRIAKLRAELRTDRHKAATSALIQPKSSANPLARIHVSPRYGKVSSRFLGLHRSRTHKKKMAQNLYKHTTGLYRQSAYKEAMQWASQSLESLKDDPVQLVRKTFFVCERRSAQSVQYSRTRPDGSKELVELMLEMWGPFDFLDRLDHWCRWSEKQSRANPKQPYPIFIPTKGRAHEAHLNWSAAHCLGVAADLDGAGTPDDVEISLQPLVIAVVEPSEADSYRDVWPHLLLLILPEDAMGIAFSRWCVQKFCTCHKECNIEDVAAECDARKLPFCWMCDDNITCFYRLDDLPEEALQKRERGVFSRAVGRKRERITDGAMFTEAFLAVQDYATSQTNVRYALCGFLRDDGTASAKGTDWAVDSMSIFKLVLLNLSELSRLQVEYIPQLHMFEDVCLCAQVQHVGGKTLKAMRYCYRAENKSLGGCSDTRAARAREKRATEVSDLLDLDSLEELSPLAKTSLNYVCEWVRRDENFCHRKAMLEDAKGPKTRRVILAKTTSVEDTKVSKTTPLEDEKMPKRKSPSQQALPAATDEPTPTLMKLIPKAKGGMPVAQQRAQVDDSHVAGLDNNNESSASYLAHEEQSKICKDRKEEAPPDENLITREVGAKAADLRSEEPEVKPKPPTKGVVVRLVPVVKASARNPKQARGVQMEDTHESALQDAVEPTGTQSNVPAIQVNTNKNDSSGSTSQPSQTVELNENPDASDSSNLLVTRSIDTLQAPVAATSLELSGATVAQESLVPSRANLDNRGSSRTAKDIPVAALVKSSSKKSGSKVKKRKEMSSSSSSSSGSSSSSSTSKDSIPKSDTQAVDQEKDTQASLPSAKAKAKSAYGLKQPRHMEVAKEGEIKAEDASVKIVQASTISDELRAAQEKAAARRSALFAAAEEKAAAEYKAADKKVAAEQKTAVERAPAEEIAGAEEKFAQEKAATEQNAPEEKAATEKTEEKVAQGKAAAEMEITAEQKVAAEKAAAEQTAVGQQRAAREKAAAEKSAAEKKAAEEVRAAAEKQTAAEQKAAQEKAAEQKAAQEKARAEEKAAEEKAAGDNAAEEKVAQEKAAAEKKASAEKKAAEEIRAAAEKRAAAERKAAQEKAAEQKAAQKKAAAEQKAAEESAAAETAAAEEKAAQEKAAAEKKAAAAQKAAEEVRAAAEKKAAAELKAAQEKAAEQKAAQEKAAAEKKAAEEKAAEERAAAEQAALEKSAAEKAATEEQAIAEERRRVIMAEKAVAEQKVKNIAEEKLAAEKQAAAEKDAVDRKAAAEALQKCRAIAKKRAAEHEAAEQQAAAEKKAREDALASERKRTEAAVRAITEKKQAEFKARREAEARAAEKKLADEKAAAEKAAAEKKASDAIEKPTSVGDRLRARLAKLEQSKQAAALGNQDPKPEPDAKRRHLEPSEMKQLCGEMDAPRSATPQALAAAALLEDALKRRAVPSPSPSPEVEEEPEFEFVEAEPGFVEPEPGIASVKAQVEAITQAAARESKVQSRAESDTTSQHLQGKSGQRVVGKASAKPMSVYAKTNFVPPAKASAKPVSAYAKTNDIVTPSKAVPYKAVVSGQLAPSPHTTTPGKRSPKVSDESKAASDVFKDIVKIAKAKANASKESAAPKNRPAIETRARTKVAGPKSETTMSSAGSSSFAAAAELPLPKAKAKQAVAKAKETAPKAKEAAPRLRESVFQEKPAVSNAGLKRKASGGDEEMDEASYMAWLQQFWPEACTSKTTGSEAPIPTSPPTVKRTRPATPAQSPTPAQGRSFIGVAAPASIGMQQRLVAKGSALEQERAPPTAAPRTTSSWSKLRATRTVLDLD